MNSKNPSNKNRKAKKTNRGFLDRDSTVGLRGNPRKRLLIVCEGTKTEPNYFNSLYKNLNKKHLRIEVKGEGKVTLSLVEKAIQLRDGDGEYDETWCVFDRDVKKENKRNKNQQDFNSAVQLAIKQGIRLAISNDAFELWYLLHYEYYTSETHRKDLNERLSDKNRLGTKYEKKLDLYDKSFKEREQTAVRNAETLWNSYNPSNEAKDIYDQEKLPDFTDQLIHELIQLHNNNPSTTVYMLVKRLIALSQDSDNSATKS